VWRAGKRSATTIGLLERLRGQPRLRYHTQRPAALASGGHEGDKARYKDSRPNRGNDHCAINTGPSQRRKRHYQRAKVYR
jgi:hypothetical protein